MQNKVISLFLTGLGHLHQESGKDYTSEGLTGFGSSKKKKKRRHRLAKCIYNKK